MVQNKENRIEYIDAMRGVAMILVVYFHIAAYGLGSYEIGYNDLIERFRMPAFFFISGWLFYKPGRIWDGRTSLSMIKKKFMVQIIPTICFMMLYLYTFDYLDSSSFGSDKKGYWFTFVLFEYFVIYIVAEALLNKRNTHRGALFVFAFMLILSATAFYYAKNYTSHAEELGNWKVALGLLSFVKIRHIIFFWFGTFVRRHFTKFVQLTDNSYFIGAIIAIFAGLIVDPTPFSTSGLDYPAYLLSGITGIIIFFTFFRKHQERLSQATWCGRILQHIGRRTLDIYLLHYFVLPYNLMNIDKSLLNSSNNSIAMLVSLTLALWVVTISLLLSSIIRLSPFLGKYLFGAKNL